MQLPRLKERPTSAIELFQTAARFFGVNDFLYQENNTKEMANLDSLSDEELKGLKKLTEISVRRHKDRLVSNHLIRISALFGAASAVLTSGNEALRNSQWFSQVNALSASPWVQPILGQWLGFFFTACLMSFVVYILFWLPGLKRVQKLDDAVQLAMVNRKLYSQSKMQKQFEPAK